MYKTATRFAQHYLEKTGKSVSHTGPVNSNRKRKPASANVDPLATFRLNVEKNGTSKRNKPKNRAGKKPTPQAVSAKAHVQTDIKPTSMEMAFLLAEAKLKSNDNN